MHAEPFAFREVATAMPRKAAAGASVVALVTNAFMVTSISLVTNKALVIKKNRSGIVVAGITACVFARLRYIFRLRVFTFATEVVFVKVVFNVVLRGLRALRAGVLLCVVVVFVHVVDVVVRVVQVVSKWCRKSSRQSLVQ